MWIFLYICVVVSANLEFWGNGNSQIFFTYMFGFVKMNLCSATSTSTRQEKRGHQWLFIKLTLIRKMLSSTLREGCWKSWDYVCLWSIHKSWLWWDSIKQNKAIQSEAQSLELYMKDFLRTDVFIRYNPETIACTCIELTHWQLELSIFLCIRLLCGSTKQRPK